MSHLFEVVILVYKIEYLLVQAFVHGWIDCLVTSGLETVLYSVWIIVRINSYLPEALSGETEISVS